MIVFALVEVALWAVRSIMELYSERDAKAVLVVKVPLGAVTMRCNLKCCTEALSVTSVVGNVFNVVCRGKKK